jgi:hypothetical protein
MRSLAGLVKQDLAAATEQDRRYRSTSTSTSTSTSGSGSKKRGAVGGKDGGSSRHRHHHPPVDPAMAQQVRGLLAAMERAPRDRRLATNGLGALRYYAAHEATTHEVLLQPEALRVLWDAAQLHATDVQGGSDAVLEEFIAALLCLTEHGADRARVRKALPVYAPFLMSKLRARVDRGSTGARALEVLTRRLAVST